MTLHIYNNVWLTKLCHKASMLIILCACTIASHAQQPIIQDDNERSHFDTDSIRMEGVPEGIYAWTIDRRFGTIRPAEYDTIHHLFPNEALTDGMTGHYNFTGNLGAPRISRLFTENTTHTWDGQFIFEQPYGYFLRKPEEFLFTNTKSPFTNLSYHECGNKQHGEDRFRAIYSINVNKRIGLGFKIDYLYGRGYYDSQATSQFNGTIFGSYVGTDYQLHAMYYANHMKMSENGGIEDDRYIEDPQSFPQRYSSKDIPVTLSETWNRNHEQTFYLTHRYNAGFYRDIEVPDSLKPQPPSTTELLLQLPDSIRTILRTDSVQRAAAVDSLLEVWRSEQVTPQEFVPVTSFIHTMQLHRLKHGYVAHRTPTDYYTNHYYGDWNDVKDETRALQLRNTLGVALREGFNRWAQSGISLYGSHRLNTYTLPLIDTAADTILDHKYVENDLSIGGTLSRTQGKAFHYNVDGEFWLVGPKVGDFNVDGQSDVHLPMGRRDTLGHRRDTLDIDLRAYVHHQKPDFYLRHYHSQATWWDNGGLDRELRTRVMGTLSLRRTKTRLTVGLENMTNYTYFGIGYDEECDVPYANSIADEADFKRLKIEVHSDFTAS